MIRSSSRAEARRIAALVLVLAACNELPAPPRESGACTAPSDCAAGEICAGGSCVPAPGDQGAEPARFARARLLTESLRFTDVGRGRQETRSVRLRNEGEANLTIDRIDVVGASGRLVVSPNPLGFRVEIPPLAELPFSVQFTASDGVSFSSTIVLHTSDPVRAQISVPAVVVYTGAPLPVLTASPAGQHAEALEQVDVGPVPEGIGRVVPLYLKNLGSGGMFALCDPPRLEGDRAFALTVSPPPDADGVHRLARFGGFCDTVSDCDAAESCQAGVCGSGAGARDLLVIEVGASLVAGELATAELVVPYRSPLGGHGGELRVSLVGRGVAPGLLLEPASVDFGAVSIGFPESQLVRITNVTSEPVSIAAALLAGAGAEPPRAPLSAMPIGAAPPLVLAPGQGFAVRLDFLPSSDRLGPAAASLEVTDSAGPHVIEVSGRARVGPQIITAPLALLDAGTTHVGTAASSSLLIANAAAAGADHLTIAAATAEVASGSGEVWLDAAALAAPIAPGEARSVAVLCRPDAVGELEGALVVASDASDNPVRRVVLRCRGIDPTLALTYESVDAAGRLVHGLGEAHPCRGEGVSPCADLGQLFIDGRGRSRLAISNAGRGPLTITSAAVTSPSGLFALLSPATPFAVLAGGAVELEATFGGSASEGIFEGELVLAHDDLDAPPVRLRLVASTASCAADRRDCSAIDECRSEQTAQACCKALDDPEACGAACAPCPPRSHMLRRCEADACAYACQLGWIDLDADTGNGCEYACYPSGGGFESCDGIDNDCDGWRDDGLTLTDVGGEAPAFCTPGSAAGRLGEVDEADLGSIVIGGSAAPRELAVATGFIYVPTDDPAGDVDWWRLVFREGEACAAVGFRLDVELVAPEGAALELCGAVQDPAGAPPHELACGGALSCSAAAVGQSVRLGLEWPEVCGSADDRVVDLRLGAAPDAAAVETSSCEPYRLVVSGARLY